MLAFFVGSLVRRRHLHALPCVTGHNRNRARPQLRLVESMEEQMPEMEECVRKCFQTVNG